MTILILSVATLCYLFFPFGLASVNTCQKPFPRDFIFGVATAAYQVEGGWDADGKGENIWDRLTHSDRGLIASNHTGDVACDSYHFYRGDVELLKYLGVDVYRFSLSWSRILPNGHANKINTAGVVYYKKLIEELKSCNITPYVTLYHWDLPQPLQEIGGWPNPVLADIFADYARLVFSIFGEDVKHWLTFNEIQQICHEGYGVGVKAPAIISPGQDEYRCGHTIIKAHAKAYRIYQNEFREKQGGQLGIVIDTDWYEPATNRTEDINASDRSLYFRWGHYAHPIVYGNYPQIMIDRVAMRSKKEGFLTSRLPSFTEEEMGYIKGSYDFLGLNQYSAFMIKNMEEPSIGEPSWDKDMGTECFRSPHWKSSASMWLYVTPFSIRKTLRWIKEHYGNPNIIITENGFSDRNGILQDDSRVSYIREYLTNVRDAKFEDGVNVFGYIYWSLMDNFEWFSGYTEKFGLYHVDFDSRNRTRTPKKSAGYYKNVISSRCL